MAKLKTHEVTIYHDDWLYYGGDGVAGNEIRTLVKHQRWAHPELDKTPRQPEPEAEYTQKVALSTVDKGTWFLLRDDWAWCSQCRKDGVYYRMEVGELTVFGKDEKGHKQFDGAHHYRDRPRTGRLFR